MMHNVKRGNNLIVKNIFLSFTLLCLFFLVGCKNGYDSEEAIKRGDIVLLNDKIYNIDKFKLFLNNVSNSNKDKIRITYYTLEGDPIYKDLTFDGKEFKYKNDHSFDKNAGTNIENKIFTCTKLERNNEGYNVDFTITGCNSKPRQKYPIISIPKNDLEKIKQS